ncbi:helix-turn-helix transcriptional regulator [Serratia marcescens]|uniref:helix-turn-helix transcriptional regulator n=1 Tax=Serratia marcescens TaxID=615 RepID=UPI001020A7F6|nr:helix-turn-helix transcriptional regulator [Serratia marcescens]RZF15554.1 hypothetical protein B7L32_08395 [Serratia marcescens]
MKNTLALNIAIIDNDRFYAAGLFMALSIYFKSKKIKVVFLSEESDIKSADIIFQAIRSGVFVNPYPRKDKGTPLYFAVADRNAPHLQHLYRDVKNSNILSRCQSVISVLQRIEKIDFNKLLSTKKELPESGLPIHEPLTAREYEVLSLLKQGKTPACAAITIGVKEKTISTHKRAAMRKLNFIRTNELFHWMLQGGLSHCRPRKSN